MKLKLILSFMVVALVAVISVTLFVRLDTANQVVNYLFRGGMMGIQSLVDDLEKYYQDHQSWNGVSSVFDGWNGMQASGHGQGPGMMGGQGMRFMVGQMQLADTDGNILYDSENQNPTTRLNPSQLNAGILLKQGSRQIGYLLVEGGGSAVPGQEKPFLESLNRAALRAAGVAVVLALLLGIGLSRGLIRPVESLTRAAQRMSAGDLGQRVSPQGTDELAVLAKSFNSMAESLQLSEQRRKAMTADIAHELRTPLAVQRAQMEAMLDGVYPMDSENLARVLDQTELLTRLVDDLRILALADAGELSMEKVAVNLNSLVTRIAEKFKPVCEGREIEIQLPQKESYVLGDPARLEQILNNLVGNALRHTPDTGKIRLDLRQDDRVVMISVSDSGPGIPPGELDKIFDRFYRLDKSRSRQEGGTGLGLAIARQLALAHGGELVAGNNPEGGAKFELTLPSPV